MVNIDYETPVIQMGNAIENFDLKDPLKYGTFLAQSYYYVAHSTRMLAFAAGHMPNSEEAFFRRFVRHIGEEASHEILALKDLQDLGMTPQDFAHLPETRSLWEPQYYKMQFEDPMSLMGYILALEHFSCKYLPKFLKRIDECYNGKAHRFVKLHAEEDPDHVEKALALVQKLSPSRQEMIYTNICQTAQTYSAMVRTCSMISQSTPLTHSQQNTEASL